MTSNLPILPVALPLVAGIALLFLRDRPVASRWFSMIANLSGLAVAWELLAKVTQEGIQTLGFGSWPAPYGIFFAVDTLSALMVLVTMVVSTATLLFACFSLDDFRERSFFYVFFQFLLVGVNGSFLTGDLFNLFVWFEVLLISSYALLVLGSEGYQLQETFKYLVMNAVSSTLFLIGVAVIYSLTGTLNLADLSVKLAEVDDQAAVAVVAVIFMTVFGIKGGLFPLYVWLPRAYFAPPTVVSALFGGLLTKVGVYALFRTTSLLFADHVPFVLPVLIVVSAGTMFFGVLGALAQWDFKRVLSFHIISQIGYMIMGLAIYTPLALAGAIFYIVHHILVKTALFLIAGAVEKLRGTTHLLKLGGVLESSASLTFLFLVAGLSLAGVPPLSGFVAKLMLIRGGLEQAEYGIVIVSVVVSFLTLFSMMKIFRYAFWGDSESPDLEEVGACARLAAVAILGAAGIVLGLGAYWAVPYAERAAEELLDKSMYVEAVLGHGGAN
jgi:multicomponent Na+:H+ antiporter subunit D